MLYLHDIYNVGRISIYVIKTYGETLSPPIVETQDHCVPDMNDEYIDHKGDDSGGGIEENAPDTQPITDLIEWRPESSGNAGMTTQTPFEPLHDPDSLIINDPIIVTLKMSLS